MFPTAYITIHRVGKTQTVRYVNEHFLKLFQNQIKIDFDDKIDEEPESPSFWQMVTRFFGYPID